MVGIDLNYYQKVVDITEEYLGPAADRFIRRQCEFHLNKSAEQINKRDLPKLAYGVGIALGLLVDDKETVNKAVKQISTIN